MTKPRHARPKQTVRKATTLLDSLRLAALIFAIAFLTLGLWVLKQVV